VRAKLPLQKSSFSPATAPENLIAFDGAKLTGERVFDVGSSSSLVPGNGARKFVDSTVLNGPRKLLACS
jgi:hypothetical protein